MDVNAFAGISFMVLMVVGFLYASKQGEKLVARQKARIAAARPAQAKVLAAKEGNTAITGGSRAPEVVLRLDVDGREVVARWHVFPLGMAKVQEGSTVAVRVDAQDPDVIFPDGEWAQFAFMEWSRILKGEKPQGW